MRVEYGDTSWPSWMWGRDDLPTIMPAGDVVVWLRIVGSGVDYPVAFPRVPIVGERITGPDDFGTVEIIEVEWRFKGGFAFTPMPVLVARRQQNDKAAP